VPCVDGRTIRYSMTSLYRAEQTRCVSSKNKRRFSANGLFTFARRDSIAARRTGDRCMHLRSVATLRRMAPHTSKHPVGLAVNTIGDVMQPNSALLTDAKLPPI
jgi:hypothetical protein